MWMDGSNMVLERCVVTQLDMMLHFVGMTMSMSCWEKTSGVLLSSLMIRFFHSGGKGESPKSNSILLASGVVKSAGSSFPITC